MNFQLTDATAANHMALNSVSAESLRSGSLKFIVDLKIF